MLAASCRLYAVFIFFMLKILQLKKNVFSRSQLLWVVLFYFTTSGDFPDSRAAFFLVWLCCRQRTFFVWPGLSWIYSMALALLVCLFCDSLCARDCSSLWNLPALILAYTFQVIFEIRLMCISFSNVLVMGLNESLYLKIILVWNLKINLI